MDYFVPPEILAAGGDRRTRARILVATCLVGGFMTTVAGAGSTWALGLAPGIAWLNVGGGAVIVAGAFVLRRTGWLQPVANGLLLVGWAMNMLLFLGSGGKNFSALYAFSMLPLIATLIAGSWTGLAWAAVSSASVLFLVLGPALPLEITADFGVQAAGPQAARDAVVIIAWLTLVGAVYDRLRTNAQRGAEQAQARAEESERRFAEAFEAHPDGIVITDWRSLRIVECNDGFLEILGRSRREVLDGLDWRAQLAMGDEQYEAVRRALIETGRCSDLEITLTGRKDGDRKLRIHASRVELGGRPSVLATVQDVTERLHLEEQLRQSQKMEAVGQLAGAIAHDFNNMLTVISGYAEHLAEELDAESGDMAAEIHRAAERSADLTRQLLAFSRRQVLQPQVLDLNQMLRRLEKLLERLIGEPIDVELSLSSELGHVRADPGQMEQVVVNLAINARDAMPEGGTLSISTWNCETAPGRRRSEAGWVRLQVRDTGVGMDEATRQRAFEPFFTTKEQGKGTGLGLSTVHGIVSQSGGETRLRSDRRGTVIDVYLPRIAEAGAARHADERAATEDADSRAGHTILLVEDDAMVRRLASRSLVGAGYEVITAVDGQEALATFRAQQERVDLVLTDVVMPRCGGADLARLLREIRPDLTVLFMSGYPNPREGGESQLPAGEAFIQKPFSPAALRQRVGELLGRARAQLG